MDVAYEEPLAGVPCRGVDTLAHPPGRPVGKGEAEHLLVRDASPVGVDDTVGKELGLATARRSQDKEVAALGLDDFLLVLVKLHIRVFRTVRK